MPDAYIQPAHKRARTSFQYRIFMIFLVVSLLQLAIVEYKAITNVNDIFIEQTAQKALTQSRIIAQLPVVQQALLQRKPALLEDIIPRLQKEADASFIVVGDSAEIRYTHPLKEKIGQKMVGSDNGPALQQGKSYSSVSKGSLGWSIRGKAPVFDQADQVIGVVSVGYFRYQVNNNAYNKIKEFLWLFAFVVLSVFISSSLLAGYLKNQMLGLEPKEIARLLQERTAIMRSLYEGFVAVDNQGLITAANPSAGENLSQQGRPLTGRRLQEFPELMALVEQNQKETIHDQTVVVGNQPLICNVARYRVRGEPAGTVISFRRKNTLETLTLQLNQARQYADTLRVQSHEYANKLSVIAGMIQLGSTNEALDYIENQSRSHQAIIDFLNDSIQFSSIRALLLGKFHRAQEMHVDFDIDKGSCLETLPAYLSEDDLIAIIGNLLDNAFEAVSHPQCRTRFVALLITDLGSQITITVSDTGIGIPDQMKTTVVVKGVTSKKEAGHGIGLHLVSTLVRKAGGTLTIANNTPEGTLIKAVMAKPTPAPKPTPSLSTATG